MWFGQKIHEMSHPDIPWDSLPKDKKVAPQGFAGMTKKDYRQMAKACNFGFPGGLGAPTFQTWALNTYGVALTLDECAELKTLWVTEFPEMQFHLQPTPDPIWDNTIDKEGKVLSRFEARTVGGRIRANSSYCSACNYPFQGQASDGAKKALWYLFMERFKVVDFIHDEVIVEIPDDDTREANRLRIEFLMVEAMKETCPDVLIAVEGSMMYRWYKEAEPVFNADGTMAVWFPKGNHNVPEGV